MEPQPYYEIPPDYVPLLVDEADQQPRQLSPIERVERTMDQAWAQHESTSAQLEQLVELVDVKERLAHLEEKYARMREQANEMHERA